MSNPFLSSTSKSGHGIIHLAVLPPGLPRIQTLQYKYPLKLVAPAPSHLPSETARLIHTIYLLTYGGGLVAGDTIDLHINVEGTARLILLTQGSTKLFKSPSRDLCTHQKMTIDLAPGSAVCYLPDPVQPFERSNFEQHQTYNILPRKTEDANQTGNLCVLDWVSNGRPANGENWSFYHYGSRNEVYVTDSYQKRRLLLRDNLVLDDHGKDSSIAARMDGQAVFGTLILHGCLLESLGRFFMEEFRLLPRIGGRKWGSGSESDEDELDASAARRATRHRQETQDRVLWSAASVRGCVLVKFSAPEIEAGRRWLTRVLVEEGSVVKLFGERALLCLR